MRDNLAIFSIKLFCERKFPDPLQLMENALANFPDMTSLFDVPSLATFPAINMAENNTGYTVTAELPGLTAEDVHVDFTDGILTIEGEKPEKRTAKEDGRSPSPQSSYAIAIAGSCLRIRR